MSQSTSYTGGILTSQFDYAKLFIWNNRYQQGTFTNGGSPVTLTAGTVLGQVFTSAKLKALDSTATDGSQLPMGILREDTVIAANATVILNYCYTGDVDAALLVFANGTDTLDTVITLNDSAGTPNTTKVGTLRKLLLDKGINPVTTSQNTLADN